jgi:hypothetical protein
MFHRKLPTHALAALLLAPSLGALALAPSTAWAGKYDVDLTPLGRVNGATISPDVAAFRSLSSELGTVVAPRPVDTADSLGLSGFAFAADVNFTTISNDASFWTDTTDTPDAVIPTLQLYGRKGLWPGIEVGGGATHVFNSRMWTVGGYAKLALHEGFHHLPIPSIAIRSAFATLVGSKDYSMTTMTPGVVISHVFGAGKTVNFTPYLGYEALLIFARSTVLDATPNCDEFPDDFNEDACGAGGPATPEFVFDQQDVILRHRPYLGLRFIFSVIRVTAEAMFVPGGTTSDTVDGVSATDASALQQQYTISIGLDF